ncbi:BLOC-1-related complex subunit 5 [Aphelenchoides bicaudatus]|nr:BLOC-1-related complex subunit 5 [Aphelenchoides bicaudatus]
MGNEQSSSSAGISSFLARNRPSTYKSPIVVVNSRANAENPEDDENLKKLKEIPRFHPILKGVLPGQRDSPSVFAKIEPKYILRFTHRLQEHFSICHQTVSSEQNSLFARITEVDQKTNAVFRRISLLGKKYEGLALDVKKIQNLSTQVESIQLNLDGIIKDLEHLNNLLPENQRLPELPKMPANPDVQTELAADVLVDGVNN